MKNITPIVAYITMGETTTTIPALNVPELYNALAVYTKEAEEQWVEWMAALPSQEEVQAKLDALKGTGDTQIIQDHTIGDWDECLSIELMPQWWVDRLITPFINQVRKLATELNGIIGHPENPFPENVIDNLVEESFKLIQEPRPKRTNWDEEP